MISVNSIVCLGEEQVFRVLWISPDNEFAYVYDIQNESLPQKVMIEELKIRISDGTCVLKDSDDFLIAVSEDVISERDKQHRDLIWEKLKDLLSPQNEPGIYERKIRGELLRKCIKETGLIKKTLYAYLRKYWRCGKNINAFLPDTTRAGGRGTTKTSDRKLGRPNKYGVTDGIYVDEKIRQIFKTAVNKYYHTRQEHSFKAVYELMIRDNFSIETLDEKGNKTLELLDSNQIPTLRQFRYWYYKNYSHDETLKYRKGENKFNLNYRALVGKTDTLIMGPGAKYQIDATVGDIYLVSQFNRADIIGRPILYFVIDTFSRMITGMYVGLEGPSWIGAMMALANAASDKVKFCAEYGVEITEEDWPCHHIPDVILGDRGEMESKSADTLVNALGVRIENAPPYRADIKGIIEQYFHTVNTTVTAFLPGNVKPDMGERTGRDYRLDAKLDINQFTKIIIECVLYHNKQHYMESFERSIEMIEGEVPPIPIKLWNWGIIHRSGLLRAFPEDVVKLCLMPTDTAMVTSKGIRFKGVYYICDIAVKEKWLERARSKGNFKVMVSYDPRNMTNIYIRSTIDNSYEICILTDWQQKYNNKCLDEIVYLQETEKLAKENYSRKKLTARVNLSAKVDEIVSEAEELAKQTEIPKSKQGRIGNIRENRSKEKVVLRNREKFDLSTASETEIKNEEISKNEESPYLDLIKRNAEERKHD